MSASNDDFDIPNIPLRRESFLERNKNPLVDPGIGTPDADDNLGWHIVRLLAIHDKLKGKLPAMMEQLGLGELKDIRTVSEENKRVLIELLNKELGILPPPNGQEPVYANPVAFAGRLIEKLRKEEIERN